MALLIRYMMYGSFDRIHRGFSIGYIEVFGSSILCMALLIEYIHTNHKGHIYIYMYVHTYILSVYIRYMMYGSFNQVCDVWLL